MNHAQRTHGYVIGALPWVDGGNGTRTVTIVARSTRGDEEYYCGKLSVTPARGLIDLKTNVPPKLYPALLRVVEDCLLDARDDTARVWFQSPPKMDKADRWPRRAKTNP